MKRVVYCLYGLSLVLISLFLYIFHHLDLIFGLFLISLYILWFVIFLINFHEEESSHIQVLTDKDNSDRIET